MKLYTLSSTCLMFLFLAAGSAQTSFDPNRSTPEIRQIESENYFPYYARPSIPDLLKNRQVQERKSLVVVGTNLPRDPRVGGASTDPNVWLATLAGNSDAIAIGRPTSEVSQLTAEKTFLFSDYAFEIDEVIKDVRNQMSRASTIVVSRPGGRLEVDGILVTAVEREFQPFVLGDRYLLFLHRLPKTGTYLVRGGDAYSLTGNQIAPMQPSHLHMRAAAPANSFLQQLRQYTRQQDGGNQ